MTRKEVEKKAITPKHDKMVVLENGTCAPFVPDVPIRNYICI
jgi:hypothetical protein